MKQSLGFLGCGKMASALVGGVVGAKLYPASSIFVYDSVPAASAALAQKQGVRVAGSAADLAFKVTTLVLCVKPADAPTALQSLGGVAALKNGLLISIVAGLSLEKLEALVISGGLASASPVLRTARVMPNTPALVGQGATAFALGAQATEEDAETVKRLFASVGYAAQVKETLLDAVTGLSGSGPAYAYLVIEALADGGVLMGLPRDLALQLAAQTVAGAAAMVLQGSQQGVHPAALKDQVTSPAGTTIAGVMALETAGVRAAMMAAVRAATERSRELGR